MDLRTVTKHARLGVLILSTLACGGDGATTPASPSPTTLPAPQVIDVLDADNQGDGRDLTVVFTWAGDAGTVDSWGVVVFPDGADPTDPGSGTVNSVTSASLPVTVSGTALLTVAGDPLQEGAAYRLRIRAVVGGEASPWSTPSAAVTLERAPFVRTLAVVSAGTGGMETDAEGRIYMGDFGTRLSGGTPGTRVLRFTPQGDDGVFATGLNGASGNAFDSEGFLLQSSIAGNTISRISPSGQVTLHASAGLSGPVGIAVAPGDTLFVANCGNNTIQRIAPGGASTVFAASTLLNCPNGIALADDGNLYVANFSSGNLVRISPSGDVAPFVSFPTLNLGHVTFANGVLYVAVRGLHQLAAVTLQGQVTTLAGTGQRGGRDGTARHATLSRPNDIAVSPDGLTLYFNDVDPNPIDGNVLTPSVIRALVLVPPV